jgi:hypothetical protein
MRKTAVETLWEVTLRSGRVVQGTEQELNTMFPDANWKRVARPVRTHATHETQEASDIIALPEDMDYADDPRPERLPSSSRRYYLPDAGGTTYALQAQTLKRPIPPRRSATTDQVPQTKPQRPRRGWGIRAHPLLYLGVGMLFMFALWVCLQWLGSWWQLHQQDVTYGRPRTFQIEAVVGHHDSSTNPTHFLFLNLNRHVVIIELPGGDTSQARIYNGPTLFGDGQDLTPVTAEFKDVNGDGRPDMLVHIQDQTLVYLNDGTQFQPLRPGQKVNLGG